MAYRLVHQISSNVPKTVLFRNTKRINLSTRCCAIPPANTTGSADLKKKQRPNRTQLRDRRSQAYVPATLRIRCLSPDFQQIRTLSSVAGQDDDDEYLEREDLEFREGDDIRVSTELAESQLENLRRNKEDSKPFMRLQPQQQTPYLENDVIGYDDAKAAKIKIPKFPFRENEEIDEEVQGPYLSNQIPVKKPYYLRDSYRGKKRNYVDVFDYFSKKYEMTEKTVVPHLQPCNLKPFGSCSNLVFPNALRREINPSIQRPQSEERPTATEVAPITSSRSSHEREYSTAANLKTFERFRLDSKSETSTKVSKNNVKPYSLKEYRSSTNSISLASPTRTRINKRHSFTTVTNTERSNSNTNSAFISRSGILKSISSVEKLQATRSHHFNSVSKHQPSLSNLKMPPKFKFSGFGNDENLQEIKPAELENATPLNTSLDFSQKPIPNERKKFSFNTFKLEFPKELEPQIKVREGKKGNLLQTNNLPESEQLMDNISLGKGERLIAPWPSYSESYKAARLKPIVMSPIAAKPPASDKSQPSSSGLQSSYVPVNKMSNNQESKTSTKAITKSHSLPAVSARNHKPTPLIIIPKHYYSTNKGTLSPEERVSTPVNLEKSLAKDFDCPCIEPFQPSYTPPLKRLQKRCKPIAPENICPVEPPCPPRADASLKITPKKLRAIIPSKCPCTEVRLKEGSPLPRLKFREVTEKPKICPVKEGCPPRADSGLKLARKSLPKLSPGSCPCPDFPKLTDVAPLKRINLKILQAPRICPKVEGCPPRADDIDRKLLPKKSLPLLKSSTCPCKEPYIPDQMPRLKRLNLKSLMERPECPVTIQCDKNQRSDVYSAYKIKDKVLPMMILKEENNSVRAPIFRTKPRKFSTFWRSYSKKECECIEPEFPISDITPELKRLPKFQKDDRDWSKICKKPPCEIAERADDCLCEKELKLPKLEPGECACIDLNRNMKDCEKLQRLPKCKKEDRNWKEICRKPPCKRADDNLKEKERSLPILKNSSCPCVVPPQDIKDCESLQRLPKFKKPDKDWNKICKKILCPDRADDCLETKKKPLPKLKKGKCPCVDLYENLEDCEKLERLPKFTKEDRNWKKVCPKPPCKRADDNMKEKIRSLPVLEAGGSCPCIDQFQHLKDCDNLERLPKFPTPDKDWSIICKKIPCEEVERADDCWESKKQKLPKLEPGECPCVDTLKNIKDCPSLQRLPKFKKDDKVWKLVCPKPPCKRADDNLKEKEHQLPGLKPGTCPCVDTVHEMRDCDDLPRLPKFKKPDIDWRTRCKKPCADAVRADDYAQPKLKSLPKLKAGSCPCIDEYTHLKNCNRLKRLPKCQQEDVNWKKVCKKPVCVRADDDLVEVKRKLPKLKGGFTRKKRSRNVYKVSSRKYHTLRLNKMNGFDNGKGHSRMYAAIQNSNASSSSNKQCKKLTPVSKPKCPPAITLPKCPPRARSVCIIEYNFKDCSKQKTPYPSFSECGPGFPDPPICDCKVTETRLLQPKYPIFCDIELPKAPPPIQGPIDTSLEKECVMNKLAMEEEGKTETCDTYGKLPLEFPAKQILSKAKEAAEKAAKEKGTTLAGILSKDTNEACCEDKSKQGKKNSCPVVDTHLFSKPDPKLTTDYKLTRPPMVCGKAESAKTCGSKTKRKSETKSCKKKPSKKNYCKSGTKTKSKKGISAKSRSKRKGTKCNKRKSKKTTKSKRTKNSSCSGSKKSKKQKSKNNSFCRRKKSAASLSNKRKKVVDKKSEKSIGKGSTITIKELCESRNKTTPRKPTSGHKASRASSTEKSHSQLQPTTCDEKKPEGFIEKILSFFKPRPNCPKPGEWKKKQLITDAEEAAHAAGLDVCPMNPCRAAKLQRDKKSKLPTKKGVSKAKKTSRKATKSTGSAKCKRSKSCESKSKRVAKSKSRDCSKKGSSEMFPSLCKVKEKASKGSASKKSCKRSSSSSKKTCKSSKRPRSSSPCKSKKSCKPRSSRGESKSSNKSVMSSSSIKGRGKSCSSCGSKKSRQRSKSRESLKSAASRSNLDKRRSSLKTCPTCPKSRRSIRSRSKPDFKVFPPDMPECSEKGRHRTPIFRPKEGSRKVKKCKGSTSNKKDDMRMRKRNSSSNCSSKSSSSTKKNKCKAPKSDESRKKKCKQFKTDCPPRARSTCEIEYVFKECTPQETPYPSFSEIRPPFPPLPINECNIQNERVRKVKSKLNMGIGAKGKQDKDGKIRNYSTMSSISSSFLSGILPGQLSRLYSTNCKAFYYKECLDDIEEKMSNTKKSNSELNKKLKNSIDEGIRKMQSPNDTAKENFQTVIEKLKQLAGAENATEFDAEVDKIFHSLIDNCESNNGASVLNPRAENRLLGNLKFEPKCIGISDTTNTQSTNGTMAKAIQKLCCKIMPDMGEDLSFEETERSLDDDVKDELNELLAKCKKRNV